MGFIAEPEGVDFIIKSEPLTKEQEARLSEFIAKRKQEIAETEKQERLTKASEPPSKNKQVERSKVKRNQPSIQR